MKNIEERLLIVAFVREKQFLTKLNIIATYQVKTEDHHKTIVR